MLKHWFLACATFSLVLFISSTSPGQQLDDRLDDYIRKISEGRYEEVRSSLPGETAHPGQTDPGFIYLEGLIAPDGTTALRMFHLVADTLPEGPWRDDALARMFEIYTRLSDRRGASEVLRTIKSDYPNTPYITTGYLDRVGTGEVSEDTTGRIVALYAIQVGAFSVFANAEKLAAELKAKGFSAIIYDNLLDGKHLLHLVWVGRFDTREDALPVMQQIEQLTGIRGVLREQMIWRRW